ncbi:MAG: signal peptidase II [Crocinitomicaceae bacterium]|nr:signal peptidase II [Crocinitomicaceae bacterium]
MRKDKISTGWQVIILIVFVLIVDQVVKIWIKTGFDPMETRSVIDGFFQLHYIENRGMAFGTTLGNGALAKYALSIFRLVAIIGIGYYIAKLLKEKDVHTGLIFAVGLIFAGATGNLIDGMFYDYIFEVNPNIGWNHALDADGNPVFDQNGYVRRPTGFLLGSVVDMFQFTVRWPKGMPFGLGGEQIFGAIWNVADASITIGVGIIVVRYRAFFRKSKKSGEDGDENAANDAVQPESSPEAQS